MRRYVVIAFSLQALGGADPWVSRDKIQHFFLGAFIQSAAFSIADATGAAVQRAWRAPSGCIS